MSISLLQALLIAEAVTEVEAATLAKASRIELLDSALHSPQAPLPDGNKRLSCQVLTMFLALNGWTLSVPTDDAVTTVLGVAAGELDENGLAVWLRERAERAEG